MRNSFWRLKLINIIAFTLILSLLALTGCGQRNEESIKTTLSDTYADNVENSTVDEFNNNNEKTTFTVKTTVNDIKDWKQAYIDYIYELEESFDGYEISYSPCSDFSGDGIDDFVCSIYNDYFVKDIACVYYNGGVATFSYDKQFAGAAYEDKYLFLWPDEEGDYDVKYYKFSNGQFVFVKNGYSRDAKGTSECHSEMPLGKYEMILEIKNGNDHGFY